MMNALFLIALDHADGIVKDSPAIQLSPYADSNARTFAMAGRQQYLSAETAALLRESAVCSARNASLIAAAVLRHG